MSVNMKQYKQQNTHAERLNKKCVMIKGQSVLFSVTQKNIYIHQMQGNCLCKMSVK